MSKTIQNIIDDIEKGFNGEELLYGEWQKIRQKYDTLQSTDVYIVIFSDSTNYSISENFTSLEQAVNHGIEHNYGRNFKIAKRVDYKITE